MPLLQLILLLIVIGVLLGLLNRYGREWIDGTILRIINIVVIVAVVLFLLSLFVPLPWSGMRVGR